MFVVLDCAVQVSTVRASIVTRLDRGAFFGTMSILEGGPRAATVATGDADAVVVPIDRTRFVYMTAHQPAFALAVTAGWMGRVGWVCVGVSAAVYAKRLAACGTRLA